MLTRTGHPSFLPGAADFLIRANLYPHKARRCAVVLCAALGMFWMPAHARALPADLQALIDQDTKLLRYAKADLNGDGRSDYVFILEKLDAEEEVEEQRELKIALRGSDGKLRVVKGNKRIILCSSCGGMWRDPLQKLEARTKSFTIFHYGGSSSQWSFVYRFDYSKRDDSWQLVFAEEGHFNTHHHGEDEIKRYRPPKDFGKIDIEDFEPLHFLGVGSK